MISQFTAWLKGKNYLCDGRAVKDGHLTMTAFRRVRFRAQGTHHLAQIERVTFAGKALRRI